MSFTEAKKQLHCAFSVSGDTTTAKSLISHVSHAVKLSETCTSNRTVSATAVSSQTCHKRDHNTGSEKLDTADQQKNSPSLAPQYSGLAPSQRGRHRCLGV